MLSRPPAARARSQVQAQPLAARVRMPPPTWLPLRSPVEAQTRLLQKRPEDRYQSAEELMSAVDHALRGEHPDNAPAGAVKKAKRAPGKRKKKGGRKGRRTDHGDEEDGQLEESGHGGGSLRKMFFLLLLAILGGMAYFAYELFLQ